MPTLAGHTELIQQAERVGFTSAWIRDVPRPAAPGGGMPTRVTSALSPRSWTATDGSVARLSVCLRHPP